jgi:hypothetical protein
MENKNNNLTFFVCVLLFCIAYFFIEKNLNQTEEDIHNNTVYGIGKIFHINSKRNFTDARYFYFYKGNRYESGKYIDVPGNKYLNKFFKIEFSSKNPDHCNIFLDQEINDSFEIKKAGF